MTAPVVLPCLSILQPWSHFICNGLKDVENRSWNTKLRGLFLVHAGKRMSKDDWQDACAAALISGTKRSALPCLADLSLGGIVGAAELLDVLPPGSASDSAWYQGSFGFLLGRRIALPFRPFIGARQFFPVPITDTEAVALREAGLLPTAAS